MIMFLSLPYMSKYFPQLTILPGLLLFTMLLFSCDSTPVQKLARQSNKKLEVKDIVPDSITSPEQALQIVKEGYNRYQSGRFEHIHIKRITNETDEEPNPFVAIITCKDFSIPPEILFDLDKNNLIVLESPANTDNDAAIKIIRSCIDDNALKLVLVLGHSNCATIREGIFNASNILPADIKIKIKKAIPAGVTDTTELRKKTTINNIIQTMNRISLNNAQLDSLVKKKTLKIAGAYYNALPGHLIFDDSF
jgi:carbonic anhydrase